MPYKTLADIPEGQSACVESLQVQGSLRSRLSDLGLIPGTPVVCVHSGKGIAAYRIRGTVIALRHTDASGIRVTTR